ncbi:GroES-like protein, partial [Flagelloscypha sp. PMI_526]
MVVTPVTANVRAVLHGPKNIKIEEAPIAKPGPGEAQVAIKATGLCGSDLHYYLHARNGDFVHDKPAILGHEASGQITVLGEGVTHLKVGDRVAIEAGIQCGLCRLCLDGKYNLCTKMRYCSSAKGDPKLEGTLQTAMNHPAHLLHLLPEPVTYEQASIIEPLAVCLHAAARAPISSGDRILVIGAGAMGMLMAAVAKTSGAGDVVIVDIAKERVDFAVKQGFATAGFLTPTDKPRPMSAEEGLKRAKEQAEEMIVKFCGQGGDGFDRVYECSGVEACVQLAFYAVRPAGKVALVGMGTSSMQVPMMVAIAREVDIVGVMRSCNDYPKALSMLGAGRFPGLENIVTAKLPLEKTVEAFEMLLKGKDERGVMMVKIMVGEY